MEKATRILVTNRPKLMRDVIVATLSQQPGIEIVGEVSDETEILSQVHATLPDFLVIALDETEERPQICDRVLREHPDLRIIAVASRKDRTLYYWASFYIHCADILSAGPKGDISQGNIVRKPSPFSDVPSFLDLYVQVSNHDLAPQRFGVEILSSSERHSNELAMDIYRWVRITSSVPEMAWKLIFGEASLNVYSEPWTTRAESPCLNPARFW